MHTRKHSVGSSILRALEIALFFAISVLGYSLLLKASSFNAKSKNRDRESIVVQNAVDLNGRHRELKVLSGTLLLPHDTKVALPNRSAFAGQAVAAIHPLPHLILAVKELTLRYRNGNNRISRPYNLLEQNPVLLN
ncbi:hypothetical protein NY406_09065 [Chlorobaculum sp. MV4-Y]|jgi:hypothetical protein|uniref:hypothetical protein n=1 Tax=Chlorobaculum sp. MV4-Y TaxID=2976335 RepID=UPI0021AE58B9|nr:hypothetical protein [Chlorobaculum sp. MV4-Y]UWX57349.1 hypothetical protein NY406_09065 [Chlorobaculum sp. MV4-Y]